MCSVCAAPSSQISIQPSGVFGCIDDRFPKPWCTLNILHFLVLDLIVMWPLRTGSGLLVYHLDSALIFAGWLYVTAGGVIASIVVGVTVFWVGAVDGVGFHQSGPLFSWSGIPVSIGLYGFCYSGHAVFPNIYSSLKNRNEFNKLLFVRCSLNVNCHQVQTAVQDLSYSGGIRSNAAGLDFHFIMLVLFWCLFLHIEPCSC